MPCIRCLIQLGLTRHYSPFWFSIDWSQRVIPGLSPTLTYLSSRPRFKKKNGIPMVTLGLAVDPLFDCQWNNLKRKEFPLLFMCVCAMSWQFRSMLLWRSGKNRADIDGRDVPCFFDHSNYWNSNCSCDFVLKKYICRCFYLLFPVLPNHHLWILSALEKSKRYLTWVVSGRAELYRVAETPALVW